MTWEGEGKYNNCCTVTIHFHHELCSHPESPEPVRQRRFLRSERSERSENRRCCAGWATHDAKASRGGAPGRYPGAGGGTNFNLLDAERRRHQAQASWMQRPLQSGPFFGSTPQQRQRSIGKELSATSCCNDILSSPGIESDPPRGIPTPPEAAVVAMTRS